MLSSNTVLPEKSLIAVILVAQELNLLYMIVMSVGFGGGGGRGGRSGCTEFCTFSCSPKAVVPCSNKTSWPTISEFNKFYSPI